MRSLIAALCIVSAIGGICGCASVAVKHLEPDRVSIDSKYSELNLSQGVSREDAVIVAQHHMLSKGYDYDWWVGSPTKVTDDPKENAWTVEFAPKEDGYGSGPRRQSEVTFQMLMPYWATVNKENGKISVVAIQIKHK